MALIRSLVDVPYMVKASEFDLSQDDRIVLWSISRTRKTKHARIFRWKDVQRKKACRGIDVLSVLVRLETMGLSESVGQSKDCWRMTHAGKLIEHQIERGFLEDEYPFLSRVIRL